jgi:hypothetical protein
MTTDVVKKGEDDNLIPISLLRYVTHTYTESMFYLLDF